MTHPTPEGFELFHPGSNASAVILVPGLCGSKMELGLIPKALIESGHTVAVPIIQGYSAHTGLTTYQEWIDSVHQVVLGLQKNHSAISLVGMSLGATLALAVEAQFQNTDNLVALSPTLQLDGWAIPWYLPFLLLIYRLGFRNWVYHESPPYGVKNLQTRSVIENAVRGNHVSALGAARIRAKHLYQSILLMAWVKHNLSSIRSNVLVMHAMEDDTASTKNAYQVLDGIDSKIKRVVWLHDSYHMISVDNEMETVAMTVNQFINEMVDSAIKK